MAEHEDGGVNTTSRFYYQVPVLYTVDLKIELELGSEERLPPPTP
jgi:hypothetical protein